MSEVLYRESPKMQATWRFLDCIVILSDIEAVWVAEDNPKDHIKIFLKSKNIIELSAPHGSKWPKSLCDAVEEYRR